MGYLKSVNECPATGREQERQRSQGERGISLRYVRSLKSRDADKIAELRDEKSHGEARAPLKMLKMKDDPEISMKTKDRTTIPPTQKLTFLHSCAPFYTKIHVFSGNRRLFAII